MRLLLVGAFAHPHEQGSQIYFQEQAIALRAAGAEIHLLSYGPARAKAPAPTREDVDRWRGLDGFPHTTIPAWAAPTSRRSGPHLGKPLADLGLALALHGALRQGGVECASSSAVAIASSAASSQSDRAFECASFPAPGSGSQRFDAILAHHAEAALLALHTLPRARPAIVYCAHTLLGQELPEYFKSPRAHAFLENAGAFAGAEDARLGVPRSSFRDRSLASFGALIDRWIASRADGWIALTQSSGRVIGAASDHPGRRLAPPVADPEPDPERAAARATARSHALEPDGFFLYSGNLDPYQDLPLLEHVARRRRLEQSDRRGPDSSRVGRFPIVIATHDERARELARQVGGSGDSGLRVLQLRSTGEAQALVSAARATIVPRRTLGGFPIKLANSLAAGVPVVALHGEEWGLKDGRDCLLGVLEAPVASLARALGQLEDDAALAARLGAGARATYLAQHRPQQVAAETLALIETLLSTR